MSLTIQTSALSKPFFGYTKKLKLPSTWRKNKMATSFLGWILNRLIDSQKGRF